MKSIYISILFSFVLGLYFFLKSPTTITIYKDLISVRSTVWGDMYNKNNMVIIDLVGSVFIYSPSSSALKNIGKIENNNTNLYYLDNQDSFLVNNEFIYFYNDSTVYKKIPYLKIDNLNDKLIYEDKDNSFLGKKQWRSKIDDKNSYFSILPYISYSDSNQVNYTYGCYLRPKNNTSSNYIEYFNIRKSLTLFHITKIDSYIVLSFHGDFQFTKSIIVDEIGENYFSGYDVKTRQYLKFESYHDTLFTMYNVATEKYLAPIIPPNLYQEGLHIRDLIEKSEIGYYIE